MLESLERRVKIVCTLGPVSSEQEQIQRLIQAGMNVARLNFSHGDHQIHKKTFEAVRAAARAEDRHVAILQDLQGPKLRVGKLNHPGIEVKAGEELLLYPEGESPKRSSGRKLIPISKEIAKPIAKNVVEGARILIDDGRIRTRAIQVYGAEIVVKVEYGGLITSNKGLNLPNTPLEISCLTEKDIEDLKFGLSLGIDAVALSFVRGAQDIIELRSKIKEFSKLRPLVFAKIERPEAVQAKESIIDESDGLLIARGDMAVELGAGEVPIVQKSLIHSCNAAGVPVITATQMLESMMSSPTPLRAEASDIANAVFDGTDAVMLSGETASGDYPFEAVKTMEKIIRRAEASSDEHTSRIGTKPTPGVIVESIEFSASKIAHHVGAVAIVCITHSGMAARTLAKFRPNRPITAIMDKEESLRKLAFIWGVQGAAIPKILQTDDLFSMVEEVVKSHQWAQDGDLIVVTAGVPSLRRGTTNMVKVHRLGAGI